jgi:hypothetical protein
MLDKTITAALLALRRQIIRENLDGLAHVEALLELRQVPLVHVPRMKPADSCKQREAKMIMLDALRPGPKTAEQLRAAFAAARPDVASDRVMIRVYQAIYRMRDKGLIVKDGGAWRLAIGVFVAHHPNFSRFR